MFGLADLSNVGKGEEVDGISVEEGVELGRGFTALSYDGGGITLLGLCESRLDMAGYDGGGADGVSVYLAGSYTALLGSYSGIPVLYGSNSGTSPIPSVTPPTSPGSPTPLLTLSSLSNCAWCHMATCLSLSMLATSSFFFLSASLCCSCLIACSLCCSCNLTCSSFNQTLCSSSNLRFKITFSSSVFLMTSFTTPITFFFSAGNTME